MSDLISRQAAIDEIITLWANKPFGNPALTEIKECVERVPSAQAEVVRCKDCKYYQKVYGGVPLGEVGHCICHSFETVPEWFCADGERKTE